MSLEADLVRQRHSVKVNEGSGVLIQPMSPDYAYVLTAKHCLKVDSQNLDSAEIQPHVVSTFDGTPISVLDVIFHDSEDMAVVIVASNPSLEIMINSDYLKTTENTFLCGYPEDRRGTVDEYSALIYEFSHKISNKLILVPKTAGVGHSNIVGFSGGGIFTLGDNAQPVLLCAIETKMDGNVVREFQGAISAIPISEFEQLIASPKSLYLDNPLAPLLPLHLSNFEHLIKFIFDVQRGWADDDGLNLLQEVLRAKVSEDIKVNIFPYEILGRFETLLKVHNRPVHELKSIGLWGALLELLTVSILIDKPQVLDLAYVENMLKSKRLMYIGGAGVWQEYIKDILFTDLDHFNKNGIIVTKTFSKSHTPQFSNEFINKVWGKSNIGRVPLKKISNATKCISKINSIIDLAALHSDCIESKEVLYENCTDIKGFDDAKETQLLTLLTNEYGAYFKVKDVNDDK